MSENRTKNPTTLLRKKSNRTKANIKKVAKSFDIKKLKERLLSELAQNNTPR